MTSAKDSGSFMMIQMYDTQRPNTLGWSQHRYSLFLLCEVISVRSSRPVHTEEEAQPLTQIWYSFGVHVDSLHCASDCNHAQEGQCTRR